ncbi:hypothetical protein B0H19DRAFT_1298247 [Mycena capillaripes]|nr:hypothetical protein B0H19DRAFT_1298247 [Mycena capillaripes]
MLQVSVSMRRKIQQEKIRNRVILALYLVFIYGKEKQCYFPHHLPMDSDNGFKKSDQIEQKVWASAPPALSKIAAQCFLIPQTLEYDLVPSPYSPSPEALAGLPDLRIHNPALHAALSQTTETSLLRRLPTTVTVIIRIRVRYDDCNIPRAVVSDHLLSGSSSIADNVAVGENGGLFSWERQRFRTLRKSVRQRRKIVARRHQGPAREEH